MLQTSVSVEPARPLSAAVARHAEEKVTHHRREAPDDHLCTCGALRETCVTATVRSLWLR